MRISCVAIMALSGFMMLVSPMNVSAASAPGPELKRVVISSAGMGLFEYAATINGAGEISLSLPLSQIDDILKSLVIDDPSGKIQDVWLPGQNPLEDYFREKPFQPAALTNPETLLQTLQGAEISVDSPRRIKGRIMSIVQQNDMDPQTRLQITRYRMAIMTDDGLQQIMLDDAGQISFNDPVLKAQLDDALKILFDNKARDRRTLHIRFGDGGKRTIHFAYNVSVPLWKTSWRLTASTADKADLQGWAILENMSGIDWQNVDLSLISGNPVALRQALYQSYYVTRPDVPVNIIGQKQPRTDQGAVAAPAWSNNAVGRRMALKSADGIANESLEAPAAAMAGAADAMMAAPGIVQDVPETAESTSQILFHFDHPVSIAQGQSLIIPVVQRSITANQLAIYQPDHNSNHPYAAIRLVNDSAQSLPPGIVTWYDRPGTGGMVFGGDAMLTNVPAGAERFLNFAIDQKITIDRQTSDQQMVVDARFVDGLLDISTANIQNTTYTIVNQDQQDRVVVLEQPRMNGWDVVQPDAKDITVAPDFWRFKVHVPAGHTINYNVALRQQVSERLDLVEIDPAQLNFYASAASLPEKTRAMFVKLATMKVKIVDLNAQAESLNQHISEITSEQERLRQLLVSVQNNSDLYKRYASSLDKEEDRLQKLRQQNDLIQNQIDKAQQDMRDLARNSGNTP